MMREVDEKLSIKELGPELMTGTEKVFEDYPMSIIMKK